MTEVVGDAAGDKHVFPFLLVLPVNLFTALQNVGSQRSRTPLGCGSGEPKLHLPAATGSAPHAPAAGQGSLTMQCTEVRMLQLPQRWEKDPGPWPDLGCT